MAETGQAGPPPGPLGIGGDRPIHAGERPYRAFMRILREVAQAEADSGHERASLLEERYAEWRERYQGPQGEEDEGEFRALLHVLAQVAEEKLKQAAAARIREVELKDLRSALEGLTRAIGELERSEGPRGA